MKGSSNNFTVARSNIVVLISLSTRPRDWRPRHSKKTSRIETLETQITSFLLYYIMLSLHITAMKTGDAKMMMTTDDDKWSKGGSMDWRRILMNIANLVSPRRRGGSADCSVNVTERRTASNRTDPVFVNFRCRRRSYCVYNWSSRKLGHLILAAGQVCRVLYYLLCLLSDIAKTGRYSCP